MAAHPPENAGLRGMSWQTYTLPVSILNQISPLPRHISLEPVFSFQPLIQVSSTEARPQPSILPCSPTTTLTSFPSSPAKKSGRRISSVNETLRLFTRTDPRCQQKFPKLENIRYKVMRTLKKTLRRVYVRKGMKRKGLLDIDLKTGEPAMNLKNFKEFAKEKKKILESFSILENGPKVDKISSSQPALFSTYNNRYMEFVFHTSEIQTIYQLFLLLIFSNAEISSLCQRFCIRCCSEEVHNSKCELHWSYFRQLLEEFMGTKVSQIGLKP